MSAGILSSRGNIYAEFQFPGLIPILALVSFRGPPSSPAGHHPPIYCLVCRQRGMWEMVTGPGAPYAIFAERLSSESLFRPMLASASFRQLSWSPVSAYFAQFRQHSMWGWGGIPSSRSYIYLKLEFSALRCQILASGSSRGAPPARSPHILSNSDNILRRMGAGQSRGARSNIYIKSESPVLMRPILASVGIRQLDPSSVSFLGIRRPHILANSDNMVFGMVGGRQSSRCEIYLKIKF